MNKTKTLETVRNLTPDKLLCSPAGRLKITLLQLVARLLPGRFAVWLSLLCEHLDIFEEAQEKGVLAEGGNFDVLLFKVRTIDISKPEAVQWYQAQLRRLFELGAAVIKVDFGEHVCDYERYQGYSGREMHNLYPLLYNQAAFEVTREYSGRGVLWARSAYAGSQRYPVHWSGDNSSTFENMLCSLRGGLSLGLRLYPISVSDAIMQGE